MLTPVYTKRFAKDLKKIAKQGKALKKSKKIIKALANGTRPGAKCENYRLIGSFDGRRECHFKPEWQLIYKITGSEIIFERMGTHSDIYLNP